MAILYILFCADDDETFNIFTILSLGTCFCRLVILYLSKMLFDLLSVNISCKILIELFLFQSNYFSNLLFSTYQIF